MMVNVCKYTYFFYWLVITSSVSATPILQSTSQYVTAGDILTWRSSAILLGVALAMVVVIAYMLRQSSQAPSAGHTSSGKSYSTVQGSRFSTRGSESVRGDGNYVEETPSFAEKCMNCCCCSNPPDDTISLSPDATKYGTGDYVYVVEKLCIHRVPSWLVALPEDEDVSDHYEPERTRKPPPPSVKPAAELNKSQPTIRSYYAALPGPPPPSAQDRSSITSMFYDMIPKRPLQQDERDDDVIMQPRESITVAQVAADQESVFRSVSSMEPITEEAQPTSYYEMIPNAQEQSKEQKLKSLPVTVAQVAAKQGNVFHSVPSIEPILEESDPTSFYEMIPKVTENPKLKECNLQPLQPSRNADSAAEHETTLAAEIDDARSAVTYYDAVPNLLLRSLEQPVEIGFRPQPILSYYTTSPKTPFQANATVTEDAQPRKKRSEMTTSVSSSSALTTPQTQPTSQPPPAALDEQSYYDIIPKQAPLVQHKTVGVKTEKGATNKREPGNIETKQSDVSLGGTRRISVMQVSSKSSINRLPSSPSVVAMESGNIQPTTAEEEQEMHKYLNQFSSVFTYNLKDPIPKDPETMPQKRHRASQRSTRETIRSVPLAENLSEVSAYKYQAANITPVAAQLPKKRDPPNVEQGPHTQSQKKRPRTSLLPFLGGKKDEAHYKVQVSEKSNVFEPSGADNSLPVDFVCGNMTRTRGDVFTDKSRGNKKDMLSMKGSGFSTEVGCEKLFPAKVSPQPSGFSYELGCGNLNSSSFKTYSVYSEDSETSREMGSVSYDWRTGSETQPKTFPVPSGLSNELGCATLNEDYSRGVPTIKSKIYKKPCGQSEEMNCQSLPEGSKMSRNEGQSEDELPRETMSPNNSEKMENIHDYEREYPSDDVTVASALHKHDQSHADDKVGKTRSSVTFQTPLLGTGYSSSECHSSEGTRVSSTAEHSNGLASDHSSGEGRTLRWKITIQHRNDGESLQEEEQTQMYSSQCSDASTALHSNEESEIGDV